MRGLKPKPITLTIRSSNLYLRTRNDRFPTKSDLEFLNAIQNNTVYR